MTHDKMVEVAREMCYPGGKREGDMDYPVVMMAEFALAQREPFATALSAANEEIERLKEVLTSVEKTLYSVGVEMYRVQGKITKALADTPLTGEKPHNKQFAYFDEASGMRIANDETKELREQIRVLTEALEKIHGRDYRGPRHISADIARKALRQALKGE
jgi:hypothetical protein